VAVVVSGIVPGGPAAQAGLTIGQVVTAVDRKSMEGATLDEFCAVFTTGPHETLTTAAGKRYGRTWPVGSLRVADRGVREGILLGLMRGEPRI
jgi:hypothetical protein